MPNASTPPQPLPTTATPPSLTPSVPQTEPYQYPLPEEEWFHPLLDEACEAYERQQKARSLPETSPNLP